LNSLILGGIQFSTLVVEMSLSVFLTVVITGFLGTSIAGLKHYSIEQIFLAVGIVHIISIVGLWMVMITTTGYIEDISPLTGHIVFLVSIAIQLAIVLPNRRERWLQVGSGIYLIAYGLFSLWEIVPFSVLGLLFVYVVLYNISVFSYGVLQYINHLRMKQERLEMESYR
jgi:hypothetical protein